MIHKLLTLIVAVVVIVGLVFAGCAKPAPAPAPTPGPAPAPSPAPTPAKPIELSLSLFIPEMHLRYQNVWKPWIHMFEEKTNGKVKITPYFANALSPMPENYDAVRTGIADIGEVLIYATPGRFPLTETLTLPALGVPSCMGATKCLMHLYDAVPEVKAEYPGVKVLAVYTSPTCRFETTQKPVYKLEDTKGLKIRMTGSVQVAAAKALGFTPIAMPSISTILALEKGTIDGAAIPFEVLVSRKWAECLKYAIGNVDFGHDMFAMVFNEDSWNKLPPDVQKVIDEMSGSWMAESCASEWDKFEAECVGTCQTKHGIENFDLIS